MNYIFQLSQYLQINWQKVFVFALLKVVWQQNYAEIYHKYYK